MKHLKFKEEINQYIESNQANMFGDLSELIAIPSESDNLPEVRNALRWCVLKANALGFSGETVLDEQIGLIEMGAGSRTLGILAHVDVVSASENDGWTHPPYALSIENGMLFGRGVIDDKGPLIATLYAMRAVMELGIPFDHKVRLILGTQEEALWSDIKAYRDNFEPPDYGYTPDGEFPIGNIENGYVDVVLSFPKKQSSKKPNDFEILEIAAGFGVNSVPETATAILEDPDGKTITIKTTGKSVHSSLPENGINPLWSLAEDLKGYRLAENGAEKLIGFISEVAKDDFHGEPFGLYKADYRINGEETRSTAMSMTLLMTKPDQFCLNYNIRPAHHVTKNDVIVGLSKYQEQYGFTFEISEWQDPLYVGREKPFLETMAAVYRESTGAENCFTAEAGTSYAKALPNVVSFGPLFPEDEDSCHEVNERIKIESFMRATKLYAYYMAEMILKEERYD